MPRRRRDTPPPRTGTDEKAVLRGFLGYLRDAVAAKAEGVPEPQVRAPGVPSGTSLLGLVRHLTAVERYTFLGEAPAGWPGTFRPRPDETAEEILAGYRAACAEADAVIDACADLAQPVRRGGPSMRWALVHLIEETGRHAGHADILRELADGTTGR
jgi:hypothetical protein